VGGIVLALYVRTRSPERYASMGRIILEEAGERAAETPTRSPEPARV